MTNFPDPVAGLSRPGLRHVFVRDLVLPASIGIYAHEHRRSQRVRLNIDLAVTEEGEAERAQGIENLALVVDYARVTQTVRAIVAGGHIRLAETLAERIADNILRLDGRIKIARVRVEKLDVFADAEACGVAIERRQNEICPPSPVDSQ